MEQKLVFLDIDGTLTPAGTNTPPDSALEAIRQARAQGHKVFLCTGRNPDMLAPVLQYGFDGFVGCGGGYVVCGDQVIYDCPMTDDQRDRAMALLAQGGVYRTLEARDGTFGDQDLGDFLNQFGDGNSELVRWRKALAQELNIRPIEEYDGRPIYKIVFMCTSAQQLAPAIQGLEQEFYFLVQDLKAHSCLNGELINRRFDKGAGVRHVAQHYGVPMENTVGFGDSMNDLEMIQAVGVSVCMENGSPNLKRLSDHVCPAVEEDGLAKAFAMLGLTG